jgi:excinuclease ABC subunit A
MLSDEIKMPWQTNGRRWHTEQRTSRDGKAIEWEGAALAFIAGEIERLGKSDLQPTNWSDRSRVEIIAKAPDGLAQSAVPWLCHFLTGGRWLLDMNLRVPTGSFKERDLAAKLALKTLDDRDDIQAYGKTPRVVIRAVPNGLDDIRILVHDKKEIATPAFKSFLAAAVKKHLDHVRGLAVTKDKGAPWKKDGKAWHLSQDSVRRSETRQWKSVDLVSFIGRVSKSLPGAKVDWSGKVLVDIRSSGGGRVARVITNLPDALRVDVWTPPGHFTPTQIERLGTRQELNRTGSSGAGLSFWFQRMEQIETDLLTTVLRACSNESRPPER